jgi:uncharacterized RDD family membrane protein YckC
LQTNEGLAGIRRRLASMMYEALLLVGVLAATFFFPQLLISLVRHAALPGAVLWIHVIGVLGIYFLWYWRHGGQTLAMQTWKLKLVSHDGSAPTWPQLYRRYALAWPSVTLLGAGLIWAVFDRDRQFLHDRLSGTRVILV